VTSSSVQVSIVIPAFNRVEPLRFTLRSAAAAARAVDGGVEILLVDDGSTPPLAEQLAGFDSRAAITHLRQPNSGSIVARLTGLAAARGEFVLFLDSDDLIHPDKLKLNLAALRQSQADISHDDRALAELESDYSATYRPGPAVSHAIEPAEFFFRVQPLPHGPVYRRDYLQRHLASPIVPTDRRMDSVGDIWLYYNLAPFPARIVKVDAPLSAIGPHEEDRFSRHWEKLGVAALLVAEAFMARCPRTPETLRAREVAGEVAFDSWRRLPRDYHRGYDTRLLGIWRGAPKRPGARLGGNGFNTVARVIGPVTAGRLLRQLRGGSYAACRTLTDEQYAEALAGI